jgi:hypothetical protein
MAGAMATLVLASMPVAEAATVSATMEVSFRVTEACAISTGASPSDQAAQVRCAYQTPYRIVRADSAPAVAPQRTDRAADANAPAAVTITF